MSEVGTTEGEAHRRIPAWAWVGLVIAIGALAGLLLFVVAPSLAKAPESSGPPCQSSPSGCTVPVSDDGFAIVGNVLSLVAFALLVALMVHFLRMYRRTRARVMLGFTVFLVALVLEASFASPVLFAGVFATNSRAIILAALSRAALCAALAIFLYLSIE